MTQYYFQSYLQRIKLKLINNIESFNNKLFDNLKTEFFENLKTEFFENRN